MSPDARPPSFWRRNSSIFGVLAIFLAVALVALLIGGCSSAQPARAKVTPGRSTAGSEIRDEGPRSERTTIKIDRTHAPTPPTSTVRIRIIERKPDALAPAPVVAPLSLPASCPADRGS